MTTIAQFPPAGPLTGTELSGVMQGGVTSQTTTGAIANLAVVANAQPLGQKTLSTTASFTATVANAPMIANYQFGSAATPGPGITTITSIADLTANFNPFESFTNLTTINSEFERYQPFNSANHAFATDRLNLTALNPNNDWNCTAVTQIAGTVNLNNTPTSIAALGLINTAPVQIGQMVTVQTSGTYIVSAIVANSTVTLQQLQGGSGGTQTSGLIFWLPVVGVPLSSGYIVGSGVTLNFASLPANVVLGMQIGIYNLPVGGFNLQRDQDYRVAGLTATTVTLNLPWNLINLGPGTIIWFIPVVTSGQIWSQLFINMNNPQCFYAIEAHLNLLGPDGGTFLNTAKTLAIFNTLPNDVPWGAWPAFWSYMADDGNSATTTGSSSEIDMMEIQISQSQDSRDMNAGNAPFVSGGRTFAKTDSGWSYLSAFGIHHKTDGTQFVGDHLYQMIFTNGSTYRFFDGILYDIKPFVWQGQRPLQFSVGLAMGAANSAAGQNTLFPNASTNFNGAFVGIKSIKVWYQPPT